jgi:hypothetical protein
MNNTNYTNIFQVLKKSFITLKKAVHNVYCKFIDLFHILKSSD